MIYVKKFILIMSTTILNFKKSEIVAESKEAAIEFMESNLFHYSGDATQAYRNWKEKQGGAVTERAVKEFMLEYLAKKSKNCPGSGYLITLDPAVTDTRERPYKIENVKNDEGKRVWKKQYKWIDRETKTVVCSVNTNKADAENALKELYKSGAYKGDADLYVVKDVEKGQPIVATAKYAPSKNTKKGSYLAFGIEA
jgi:hypothetical protein